MTYEEKTELLQPFLMVKIQMENAMGSIWREVSTAGFIQSKGMFQEVKRTIEGNNKGDPRAKRVRKWETLS